MKHIKKPIYLLCTCILWTLLSFIVHLILLVKVDHWALPVGNPYIWYSAMPVWAKISTMMVGVFLGYVIGRRWWQIVYVEHRRWKTFWKR